MRRFLIILVILILVAIACGASAFYWWWHEMTTMYSHSGTGDTISITRGMSNEHVLSELTQRGIIKSPLPVKIYLKVLSIKPLIKAGDYRFPSPISAIQVLKKLEQGGEHQKLTVIEGWTRFDIAKAMQKSPRLKLKSDKEALALMNQISLIKDIDDKATNLEGFLYPDTYYIQAETTPKGLVEQMVARFKDVWGRHLGRDAFLSGLSPHQIVTIASIVETEAKLDSERPVVASVIFNRLKKKMTLSVDSTVVYASKLAGKWKDDGKVYLSDLRLNSPYNTRKYLGLPPGPVGSPSLSSLRAAISPVRSDYLYYVRDPARTDGAHNFYSNSQDFERGVATLRAWEANERKAGRR